MTNLAVCGAKGPKAVNLQNRMMGPRRYLYQPTLCYSLKGALEALESHLANFRMIQKSE